VAVENEQNPVHRVISVVVRARDEAPSIGRCLELIRAQRTPGREVELIVIDSGSRDQTVAIARRHGARIHELAPGEFTFGGGLNHGVAVADGELIVALSAHAFVHDDGWLERLVREFDAPNVACASGERYTPDGAPLTARLEQDIALARAHPTWGYSNGAGAFRTELWRRRAFREDLPACEDKEWARHWLGQGYIAVLSPSLLVDHDHTHDPLPRIYARARREAAGFAMFVELPPYGPRELANDWWSDTRFYRSAAKARLSHRRAARLLGAYAGRRSANG
jgi:glycosyltransferase involved in cell wall biosynthesis